MPYARPISRRQLPILLPRVRGRRFGFGDDSTQLVGLPGGGTETLAQAAANLAANPLSTLDTATAGNLTASINQYGNNPPVIQALNPTVPAATIDAAIMQWCQANTPPDTPGPTNQYWPCASPSYWGIASNATTVTPTPTVQSVASSVAQALPGATQTQIANAVQSALPSATRTQVAQAVQAAAHNAPVGASAVSSVSTSGTSIIPSTAPMTSGLPVLSTAAGSIDLSSLTSGSTFGINNALLLAGGGALLLILLLGGKR